MNGETIFRALSDVGDDLLEKARTKKFVNPWRRWGKTAACLALVLCLTALVLPHFPRGCGSAMKEDAVSQQEAAETVESAEDEVEAPEAKPEETYGEGVNSGIQSDAEEKQEEIRVWFEDRAYVLTPEPLEEPVSLGEPLGTPERWEGMDLADCQLYSTEDPNILYVETPDGIYQAECRK